MQCRVLWLKGRNGVSCRCCLPAAMLSMLPISQPVIRRHDRTEFSVEPFRLLGVLAVTISRFSLPHPAGSFVPSGPIQTQSSQCRPARGRKIDSDIMAPEKEPGPFRLFDGPLALSLPVPVGIDVSVERAFFPPTRLHSCGTLRQRFGRQPSKTPRSVVERGAGKLEMERASGGDGLLGFHRSPTARRTPWHVARVNQATGLASLSLASWSYLPVSDDEKEQGRDADTAKCDERWLLQI